MSSGKIDTSNALIQLTMVLKLQQLKRSGLPSLKYSNLEDYLNEKLWMSTSARSLHEGADDILAISPQEMIRFLAKKAISDGAGARIEDFSDIIGG